MDLLRALARLEQRDRIGRDALASRLGLLVQGHQRTLLLPDVQRAVAAHVEQPGRQVRADPVGVLTAKTEERVLDDVPGGVEVAGDPGGETDEAALVLVHGRPDPFPPRRGRLAHGSSPASRTLPCPWPRIAPRRHSYNDRGGRFLRVGEPRRSWLDGVGYGLTTCSWPSSFRIFRRVDVFLASTMM